MEVNPFAMDSAHQKAHLLMQSHFSRNPLPCSDYGTDTKSVMDQAIRILQVRIGYWKTACVMCFGPSVLSYFSFQAMIDVSADSGWLSTTLQIQTLLQMLIQGRWNTDSSLLTLPHMETFIASSLKKDNVYVLPQFIKRFREKYVDIDRPVDC